VLADLPGMLDARLDPATHTFDYLLTDNSLVGYTEDTAFGILGLSAADAAAHTGTYEADVAAARLALAAAVDTAAGANYGDTYDNALSPSFATDAYAGRALEALQTPEPATVALLALGWRDSWPGGAKRTDEVAKMTNFMRKNWLWALCLAAVVALVGGAAVAQLQPLSGPGSLSGPTHPPLITPVRPPVDQSDPALSAGSIYHTGNEDVFGRLRVTTPAG